MHIPSLNAICSSPNIDAAIVVITHSFFHVTFCGDSWWTVTCNYYDLSSLFSCAESSLRMDWILQVYLSLSFCNIHSVCDTGSANVVERALDAAHKDVRAASPFTYCVTSAKSCQLSGLQFIHL